MFYNLLFWNIGKQLYLFQNHYANPIAYFSNYYSYYFGSNFFDRENLRYMRRFYLYFPIYFSKFDKVSWNHFKLLLNIRNGQKRNFYFYFLLFANSSVEELELLIHNHIYERI